MGDCSFTQNNLCNLDNMTQSRANNYLESSPKMVISDEKMADILISKYDYLDTCITNENFGPSLNSNLVLLLKFILENGSYLDSDINYKEQIDMFFNLFRNLLRNHLNNLPYSVNLLILRLIEIRASKWKIKSSFEEYYRKKIDKSLKQNFSYFPPTRNETQENISLASRGLRQSKSYGDLMNNDALTIRNTKPNQININNKGIFKDEFVIKNSDSGKAIPGVKERLVQITGHSKESIDKAKSLIDVTIKQNTSPIPFNETNNDNSDNFCQFEEDLFTTASQYNVTPSSVSSANSNIESNEGENCCQHKIKLSLKNKQVDIHVSDKFIGKKLEQFVNKYNFADFIQFDSNHEYAINIDGDSVACFDHSITKNKFSANITKIEYDRKFLFSLNRNEDKSPRVINDIKQKDESLYRN